jgi:hypothetical protein
VQGDFIKKKSKNEIIAQTSKSSIQNVFDFLKNKK